MRPGFPCAVAKCFRGASWHVVRIVAAAERLYPTMYQAEYLILFSSCVAYLSIIARRYVRSQNSKGGGVYIKPPLAIPVGQSISRSINQYINQ